MQNFNYHTHTYRCRHADMNYNDEEYVIDLIKMGFKKMAFTDHCPEKEEIDKRSKMRMKYNERIGYLESIKRLKEKYADKIEIQSGYEVEYLPGQEENLKELKEETDKIILGQHFIYDNDKKLKVFDKNKFFTDEEIIRFAEYIEEAMRLGIPDIIAHPDIYMLSRKSFGVVEEKVANMICMAAEKYNIPLEINLGNIFNSTYFENRILNNLPLEKQKEKLINVIYPCKGFWNVARNYNVKVLYGIDAHYRGQIVLWNELLELVHEILGEEIISKLNFVENENF